MKLPSPEAEPETPGEENPFSRDGFAPETEEEPEEAICGGSVEARGGGSAAGGSLRGRVLVGAKMAVNSSVHMRFVGEPPGGVGAFAIVGGTPGAAAGGCVAAAGATKAGVAGAGGVGAVRVTGGV